jgi:hypothetical protein
MNPSAGSGELVYADHSVGIAHWHNIQIIYIGGGLNVDHVTLMERYHRELAARRSSYVLSITIVSAKIPMASPEVRRRSSDSFVNLAATLKHSVVVLEGDGVWASVMRTMLRSINTLARRAQTMSIFSTVEGALDDLLPLVQTGDGRPPRRADLPPLVAELRNRVDGR